MENNEERRFALAGGTKRAVARRRNIVDSLATHGFLILSDLAEITEVPLATLHDDVVYLEKAGIVHCERKENKLFLSLTSYPISQDAAEQIKTTSVSPELASNLIAYLTSIERNWREINVTVGPNSYSFADYLPYFVSTRLYPLVIGPVDAIGMISSISKRLQKENTGLEVDRIAEEELLKMDPALAQKFKLLTADPHALSTVKKIATKFVSSRKFTAPSLKDLKDAIEEHRDSNGATGSEK